MSLQESIHRNGGITDDKIIDLEISQMKDLLSSQDETKKQIILKAAEKLEIKYQENISVISVRLQKIWADTITKHYIEEVLPDKYKRTYKKPKQKDDTPQSLFQECIRHMADLTMEQSKNLNAMLTQIQEENNNRQKQLESLEEKIDQATDDPDKISKLTLQLQKIKETTTLEERLEKDFVSNIQYGFPKWIVDVKSELSDIRHLDDFLNFIKKLELESKLTKSNMDKRRKFSTAMKILLKVAFTFNSYKHIADKLDNSANGGKWMSTIDSDSKLDKIIQTLDAKNLFGFSLGDYIEMLSIAERNGLPLPDVPPMTCSACSDNIED